MSTRTLFNKLMINKHSSGDSVARIIVNRKKKPRTLMDGLKSRMGAKMIGKSKVTGKL